MSLTVLSKHVLNKWFDKFKDSFRPTLACVACGKLVDMSDQMTEHHLTVCASCSVGVIFRDTNPLKLDLTEVNTGKPALYAACMFTQQMKTWLYQHKFYHRHEHNVLMAELLASYWRQVLETGHLAQTGPNSPSHWLIVPVPPHPRHAPNSHQGSHLSDIMRPLASSLGADFVEHGLCWRRTVTPQHTLVNRHQRRQNMQKALAVSPKLHYHLTEGAGILVVDDMITTGATMYAGLEALAAEARGHEIAGLSLCHVPLSAQRIRHRSLVLPNDRSAKGLLTPSGEQLN